MKRDKYYEILPAEDTYRRHIEYYCRYLIAFKHSIVEPDKTVFSKWYSNNKEAYKETVKEILKDYAYKNIHIKRLKKVTITDDELVMDILIGARTSPANIARNIREVLTSQLNQTFNEINKGRSRRVSFYSNFTRIETLSDELKQE